MKSVFLPLLAAAVLLGLTASLVGQTEKVAKPKESKNSANSHNNSGGSSGSRNSGNSSNSGNRGSSGSGNSNSGNNSGNSGGSSAHHEFHSPTLDQLRNSQTGQANGKGAPSSSHEYDGSKKKKN